MLFVDVGEHCTFISLVLLLDEAQSENFLDYKNRGINGSHKGQIVWKIDCCSHLSDCKYLNKKCFLLSCSFPQSYNEFLVKRVKSI